MNQEIGETAGIIWNLLLEEKSLSVSGIAKKANRSQALVNMGLGWLAREGKIEFSKSTRGHYVSLKGEQEA